MRLIALLALGVLLAACQAAPVAPTATPTAAPRLPATATPATGALPTATTATPGPTPPGTATPRSSMPTPTGAAVAWEEAQTLILSGQVEMVAQTHSRQVTLRLKDGRTVTTTEPQLDDVFAVVRRCGQPCADLALATE